MELRRKPLNDDQTKVQKGRVHIIAERCKGCGFCVEYCPRNALEMSEEFNRSGYHPPFAKNPNACVNCGLCELLCPEFAIYSTPEDPSEKGKES